MNEQVHVLAPAKLNLALAVGRAAADDPSGLHPICSWMVAVDLFDELLLTRLPPDRLSRYAILWHDEAKRRSDINWSITKDLAVRAHLAMEKQLGRSLPVQLKLEKRIPVGGGLGGGSSDAAAMLRGLNELFGLGLSTDQLADIGRPLGSDVAFLVRGGSAIVEGFGESVEPQPQLPDLHAVLVFPKSSCPTGLVYQMFDQHAPPDHEFRAEAVRAMVRDIAMCVEGAFNDLAAPARRIAPSLEEDVRRLSELAERPAHISGSGSSLFVICDDPVHAEHLAAAVEAQLDLPALAVGAYEGAVPAQEPRM